MVQLKQTMWTKLLFEVLMQEHELPWQDAEHGDLSFTAESLDLDYYYNHSGDKYLSPLAEKLTENVTHFLQENSLKKLSNVIFMRYHDNWEHLWDAMTAEYNPIDNYSMTEHEDTQRIPDITTTNTIVSSQSDTSNLIYGFNSDTPVNASDVSKTDTGSNTSREAGSEDTSRDLSRTGNIGVTTSQQMIESEYNLRKLNFLEQVYSDIDKVMALSIY